MTTSRRWCRLCRRRHKNHKERNILEHLPEIERPLVQRRLRAAWAEPDPVRAKALLEALARSLAHKRPGAAASLREGLSETLTLTRLGARGSLRRTIESTNPMESMIEIIRDHAGRVKCWESGEMRCAGRPPACSPPKRSSAAFRATASCPRSPRRCSGSSESRLLPPSPPDGIISEPRGVTEVPRRPGHPWLRTDVAKRARVR